MSQHPNSNESNTSMTEELGNVNYIPTKSIIMYTSFSRAAIGCSDLTQSSHFQEKNLRATTIHTTTDITGYTAQLTFRFFDQTIKITAIRLYEDILLFICISFHLH
jgi:hypothetical protein